MPRIRNLANVNVGTNPNDGTGDLVRDAFVKVNQGLNEIYSGGQVLAFNPDTKLTPGFTWFNDRDTGFYRPASGRIVTTLNGVDSLVMSEDGTFTWFNNPIATQQYVNAQLANFTGGLSSGNIIVEVGGSGGGGNVTVTVNGVPVVSALPAVGNYEGRIVFFNGDIWIFSGYPAGNGAGLPADSGIARAAGSDFRWVRFRGDSAVSIGLVRPPSAAEGTLFYETANASLNVYLSGSWRSYASVVGGDSLTGFEVLTALPSTASPDNFEGRTVVVGTTVSIFRSGAWVNLNTYLGGTANAGISSGVTLPSTSSAATGELFRKTGTNAGLYVFDGSNWLTLAQYSSSLTTLGIKTLATLPTNLSAYNAGDLIIVNNIAYILNASKTNWDFFTPGGASGTITGVVLSANAVTSIQLAPNAVIASKILPNVITGEKLTPGSITTRELASNTVAGFNILSNTISSAKLQTASVGEREIAANSVTSEKIAPGSITAAKLAPGALTGQSLLAANLSSISQNAGRITSGVLQSTDGKMLIDLNNKILRIEL